MTALPPPAPLDERSLALGVQQLAARDARLAAVVAQFGAPPLWGRPPGFATLVYIILEQQVSLSSARAAFQRLQAACGPLTPLTFLQLDDVRLKEIGFSRQKTGYARALAQACDAGEFNPDDLAALDDEQVHHRLVALKGIGPWSAGIYLLMALLRPDAWPHGDLALAVSAQETFGLPSLPSYAELQELAEAWRPWRAVAARILWHNYLTRRRKTAQPVSGGVLSTDLPLMLAE